MEQGGDLYPIVEVHSGPEFLESLGTKEKYWIIHNDARQLLKFGRLNTGENWAEKAACELCSLFHMPHAHYELAIFNRREGVLSPSFVPENGRLILGNELINRIHKEYDGTRRYQQREHTLLRAMAGLTLFTRPATSNARKLARRNFIGYLMFDAWIGNSDRHHENWGLVIHEPNRVTLAPTFDHASSMGRELSDETRIKRIETKDERFNVEAFAARSQSALYDAADDKRSLPTINAFLGAAKLQPEAGEYWLEQLLSVCQDDIDLVFARFDRRIASEAAIKFAKAPF